MIAARRVPLLAWACVGLALLLAGTGIWGLSLKVELADVKVTLEKERDARSREDGQRTAIAAADERQTAGAQSIHAHDQQGIAHDLAEAKRALAVARTRHADADRRLRDTGAQLAAARAQLEAGGNAAPSGGCEHQYRAAFGLLEEGHRLAEEAAGLVREGEDVIAERDAEVKALAAQVQADRALMLRAAGHGMRVPPDLFRSPAD